MSTIIDGVQWLTTADNWSGRNGHRPRRLCSTSGTRVVATVPAMVIALPIGLAIGHTGRGRFVAANVTGLWRAIPTIGVVTLVFRWQPLSLWPVLVALVDPRRPADRAQHRRRDRQRARATCATPPAAWA